nr:MAG: CinA family protein [Hyphomicrobiales bacterium]
MLSEEIGDLSKRVLNKARVNKIRIVTAESCTGGLIAASLTEIPGSSDVIECGFIVYSDNAKSRLLDVPQELLERVGAVSEEVARAMVKGALENSDAQLGIAVTGIAGPSGGSVLKPVGLVHVAAGRSGQEIQHRACSFGDAGRAQVRMFTVEAALKLLLRVM